MHVKISDINNIKHGKGAIIDCRTKFTIDRMLIEKFVICLFPPQKATFYPITSRRIYREFTVP